MAASTTPTRRVALHRIALGMAGFGSAATACLGWGTGGTGWPTAHGHCSGVAQQAPRVLVTYASRAGSTGEVAQVVSERLCVQGFDVQVRPIGEVDSLEGYQAVVLGSAVRYSSWLPEMLAFMELHQAELARLPTALFTLHMQAVSDTDADHATRQRYAGAARTLAAPNAEAFFSGKVDPATLSVFDKLGVRLLQSPVGDKRDWKAIRHWADGLGRGLMGVY